MGVLLVVLGAACFALSIPAMAQEDASSTSGQVTVVTVDEEIRAGTHQFLARSLAQAEQAEHDLFLLELNTPGGLLSATEDISRLLVDSSIPTAVYVYRESGWAFSAGVFILLSADTAASQSTASIGAAAPVLGGGGEADEKTTNATLAWLRTLAERSDRDPDLIETFVSENRTMSGAEAETVGVIDVVASDRAELLATLGLAGAQQYEPQPTVVDQTLSFFSIPYLVPLLLTLGSLGLFLAFRTGEIEVMGVISFLILLLGLWGAGMIELSVLGVSVLVAGIALVILELFLAGSDFGASGVIGLIALLFGVAMFAQEPLFPDVFSYGLFPVLVALFVSGATILFGISYFTASAIRQPHVVGVETMVGRQATVQQSLDPRGVVLIDGERYTARLQDTTTSCAVGSMVEIVAMDGNVAIVIPAV